MNNFPIIAKILEKIGIKAKKQQKGGVPKWDLTHRRIIF